MIGRSFRKIFSVRDEKIVGKNILSGVRFKTFTENKIIIISNYQGRISRQF